jgi:chorismate mutase
MNKKLYITTLAVFIAGLFSFGACMAQQVTVNTKQDLDAGRVKIDSLDNQLMKILGERERIAQAIGVYKAKNHIPPLAEARFKEVMNKSIEAGKKEGLSAEFITELMNAIHKESLRIENDSTLMKR